MNKINNPNKSHLSNTKTNKSNKQPNNGGSAVKLLISLLVLTTVFVSAFSYAFADTGTSQSASATATESGSSGSGGGGGTPPSGGGGGHSGPGGDPPSGGPGSHSGSDSSDSSDSSGRPEAPPDMQGGSGNSGSSDSSGSPGGNPPDKPDGESSGGPEGSGGPGSSSASDITYSGASELSQDTQESGKTYSSTASNEQALLITGGTSIIDNATVTKSGDSDGDESDFYGTNAAILAKEGTLNIIDSTITTDGAHANAVFAIGDGVINISDSKIETSSNNSGAIMVTGGGTLTASDLTVKTSGNSSAPIRSDRGGGTMTITGGSYESNGVGSPVVYSTADITVNDAEMISTASEGVVVEGKNSVTLNNVTMTADNNTHNGKSETYKAIFLYQSMSGDADEGTASFTSKGSEINVLNGDTIFVTNTTAEIYLENNTIINDSGDFLRIQTGAWGNEGSNGGTVTATLSNQRVEGSIIVDSISTLDLTLTNGSKLFGAIDTDDQANNIDLTLSSDSVLVLTGDTYVDSLTNGDPDNSNIYLNGHKLYVNGAETSANEGTYEGGPESLDSDDTNSDILSGEGTDTSDNAPSQTNDGNSTIPYIIGGLVLIALASAAIALSKKKSEQGTIDAQQYSLQDTQQDAQQHSLRDTQQDAPQDAPQDAQQNAQQDALQDALQDAQQHSQVALPVSHDALPASQEKLP